MKKNILKIMIAILILLVVSPFIPYKFTVGFGNSSYIKLKVIHSSQFGLVALENYDTLGIEKDMELDNYIDNDSTKQLRDEITSFRKGGSGNRFNLYGKIIEEDDGKKRFYIEKWSSPNVMLIQTYIWEEKIKHIYLISLFPIVILIILLSIFLIRINKKRKST